MIKVIGTRGIVEIMALFTLVMLIGYIIAAYAIKTGAITVMLDSLQSTQLVYVSYVLDILIICIITLLLVRRNNALNETILFRLLEAIVIGFTSFFVFLMLTLMIFNNVFSMDIYYIIAGVAAFTLVFMKGMFPQIRDVATIISSIGVGLVLGFNFRFEYALIILAAVAIYDYIAVFKSDEMVKLARELSTHDISFLMSVSDMEYVPVGSVGIKEALAYEKYLAKTHKLKDPLYRRALDHGLLPVISQISLGEGDLCLPLMAVVSSLYFVSNMAFTYGLIIACIFGIGVTMLLLKKYKKPLPAVPPIFASVSVFTGLAAFLALGYSASAVALLVFVGAIAMIADIITAISRRPKNDGRRRASMRNIFEKSAKS